MLVKLIPDHAKKQCGFLGSWFGSSWLISAPRRKIIVEKGAKVFSSYLIKSNLWYLVFFFILFICWYLYLLRLYTFTLFVFRWKTKKYKRVLQPASWNVIRFLRHLFFFSFFLLYFKTIDWISVSGVRKWKVCFHKHISRSKPINKRRIWELGCLILNEIYRWKSCLYHHHRNNNCICFLMWVICLSVLKNSLNKICNR